MSTQTLTRTEALSRRRHWLLPTLLMALLLLPLVQAVFPDQTYVSNSRLFQFTQMFMLVALATGWNLTGGIMGYVDFGYAVFFGLGAYGTGVLMHHGWSFAPAMLGGAVVAAAFALIIGYPLLRLKGQYFSIAMLGLFVAIREVVRVWKPLTGGGVGLTLPPYLNRPLFYYLTLLVAVLAVLLIWWIRRSEFGSSLVAIRDDEVGAEMRGIHTTQHKIAAYAVAAFIGGVVGGMWAYQNTFIDPDIVFLPARTVELVMMSLLGGLGTVAGPVVGAATIYWMRDVVWSNFLEYHLLAEGLLLIFIVLYVPSGIMGRLGDPTAWSIRYFWKRKRGDDD